MPEVRADQYFVWSPAASAVSVLLSLQLVDALRKWIDQGGTPSTEVTGLLLGRRDRDVSTRTVITVEDCEPILSDPAEQVSAWNPAEHEGLEAVGLMRSDLHENCAPTEADIAVIRDALTDPESIFLLVQPGKDAIGILFHTGESDLANLHVSPFPFDRELLAKDRRNLIQLPAGARKVRAATSGGARSVRKGRRATSAGIVLLCAATLSCWGLLRWDSPSPVPGTSDPAAVPVETAARAADADDRPVEPTAVTEPTPVTEPPAVTERGHTPATDTTPGRSVQRTAAPPRRLVLPDPQPPPVVKAQATAAHAPIPVGDPGPAAPQSSPEPRPAEAPRARPQQPPSAQASSPQASSPQASMSYAPAPESTARRVIQKVPGLRLLQHWRYKDGETLRPPGQSARHDR